jgi:hypothetical protein
MEELKGTESPQRDTSRIQPTEPTEIGETGLEPIAPRPGVFASILGAFASPRRTFESMRERPRFLAPMILMLVVQTAIAFTLFQSGIVAEQTIAKMEAQGKDARSIEAVQGFFEGTGGLVVTVVTAPFATVVGLLSGAVLLYFMGNLMMGARLRFAHYLSAIAYAGVVQMIDQLVRVALIYANRTFDVRLGIGAALGDATGFWIRALDTLTDPLFLWGNAVAAIAVAAYAQRSFRFGALAVLPGMVLAAILSASR